MKICIPSSESDEFLAQCTAAMSAANTEQVNFICVTGGSVLGCTAKTAGRFTDLVLLGGKDSSRLRIQAYLLVGGPCAVPSSVV